MAAVLAGLGGGTAAAAAPQKKKASTEHKEAVGVKGTSKKPSAFGRKTVKSRKKAATSKGSQTKAPSTSDRQIASAVQADKIVKPAASTAPEKTSGQKVEGNLPIGQEDKFRPTLPTDYVPSDLVQLPSELALGGKPIKLREEAAASMEKMARDAASEGLTLKVVSAYRDFAHQNRLYQAALKRHGKGQKMVGRPGRSEHFLGTTVDVTNSKPGHLLKADFAKSPEYAWLEKNAPKYGWKFTVRAGMNGRKPHQDEPWHIRYMGNPQVEVAQTGGDGTGGDTAPSVAASDLLKRFRQLFSGEKAVSWKLPFLG